MSKRAVIATSTSCLDYLNLENENLKILRMKIIIDNESFDDYVDITAEDFYSRLLNDDTLVPSSSMPSIGELHHLLSELEAEGYTEVFITTISSGLSGTYNAVKTAIITYEGNIKAHVIDSKNAAISEGFLSIEILRLIGEGINSSEIVTYIDALKTSRKQYFMVDNLRLFVANGRLSGASGMIGALLRIKPILQVNNDGVIVPFKKVRTQKRALSEMVDLIIHDLRNIKDFIITYDTSNNVSGLEYIKNRMEEEFPGYKYYEAPITPVIGCHTGIGTVGIAYFDLSDLPISK
jgi:DegV family protein with EDD domain